LLRSVIRLAVGGFRRTLVRISLPSNRRCIVCRLLPLAMGGRLPGRVRADALDQILLRDDPDSTSRFPHFRRSRSRRRLGARSCFSPFRFPPEAGGDVHPFAAVTEATPSVHADLVVVESDRTRVEGYAASAARCHVTPQSFEPPSRGNPGSGGVARLFPPREYRR